MIHTMLDLETFSLANNALIVWIGAVKFDANEIVDRFQVAIDPKEAKPFNRDIDGDTVLWWMHPDRDEPRRQLVEMPKIDMFAALDGFALWVNQTPTHEQGSCWGNGSTMDNVKLKSSYDAVGLDYPFSYRQDECYRTLRNRDAGMTEFTRVGTFHNPVDDAESQALHLQGICRRLGIVL